jgi:hypothetical protein
LPAVTVLDSGLLYSVIENKYYDYSKAQRFLHESIAFLLSVSSVSGGPFAGRCAFPSATFDPEQYFLACVAHSSFQARACLER